MVSTENSIQNREQRNNPLINLNNAHGRLMHSDSILKGVDQHSVDALDNYFLKGGIPISERSETLPVYPHN